MTKNKLRVNNNLFPKLFNLKGFYLTGKKTI